MAMSDVIVIGAGPFGLSISAHLRHRGIEHTIVGRPMNTWRAHMPLGLFLKSEPYGSAISAPTPGYDIATYAKLHGFDDYVDRVGPLSLDRFLGYADWFTAQLVPDIRDLTVTNVVSTGDGFKVEFADESPVLARSVIVATGILPYAYLPAELSGLPDLITHSAVHDRLDKFSGTRVAVIGGGQSSLQTAALLHEAGADVQVVMRGRHIVWEDKREPDLSLVGRIRRPPVQLCEGYSCVVYNSPDIFRLMPESIRAQKALSTFPPSGAWWLQDRVEGVVDVLMNHRIVGAEPHGSGVRLRLDGPERSSVEADHVIAGTGFRVDVAKLNFLSEGIQAALRKRINCPLVNRGGESSVPGLYFAGVNTAVSNGPGVRFISGTHGTSAHLARSVARRARRGAGPVKAADADPEGAVQPLTAAGSGPLPVA
jgi:thioredoxin reductase